MNKADQFFTAFLGCLLGSFLGIAIPYIGLHLQPIYRSSSEILSDQPVAASNDESFLRDVANINFDIDASEDYKRGWKDCCEFLIKQTEKP